MEGVAPSLESLLVEGFGYDRWANGLWLEPVNQFGEEGDWKVYGHILAASEVWVQRMDGISLTAMPLVPLQKESLDSLFQRWKTAIHAHEFSQEISYRNTRGDAFTRTFGDIVRHVLHHGTYHRGQLRESFGRRSLEFPETDFLGFNR
jgi:uncharacterized damage-inducible protein DinB